MTVFAALMLLAAAVGSVLSLLRVRRRLDEAERRRAQAERAREAAAAMLATVPGGGFAWRESGDEMRIGHLPPGAPDSFAEFAAALAADDAARLTASVAALRSAGAEFSASVRFPDGRAYDVAGRVAGGCTALWLADAAPSHANEAARVATEAAAAALRAAFDRLALPAWRRDAGLAIVDCNAAYAAALDTTRDLALAEGRELTPSGGRKAALDLARTAAAGTAGTDRQRMVIGGSRRLIEISETPDGAGGTVGVAVDLTELETAESELSRHVNAHAEVLENIHAAVAIYAADKRLGFFNTAFAALWDIDTDWLSTHPSLEELLERLREHRRLPEYVDFRQFKRQQLGMFTSLIEPQQELMHLPDGRTLSVAVSPHPFGGLIFVYEDVTDRLALERSYNTLIEVQRETLDGLFEGIAVFGSDGRLKLHNPAYRTIWSLSEADLGGGPHIGDIIDKTRDFYDDGGDWPGLKARLVAAISTPAPVHALLDRRDGTVLQSATVPLPDGNVLLSYQDVSDTQRVERALRERNEALETTGRLKSEFIANVSYELRTPLNAIIGFAEILANQYFGALTPRQLDYSRGILDSSHRLLSLINDILDLATIEAGYMTLEPHQIDVAAMLEAVLTLTRERARYQELDLSLRCPATIGTITADERRLKQALFNLICNAIKYTPAGGAIVLEARRDDASLEGDLVLSVSDTGVGIPPADQARVFDKFERGSRDAFHTGAGLGLSLVKSLIELHGGTVAIESTPDRGTSVHCRLPATPDAAPGPAFEPASSGAADLG